MAAHRVVVILKKHERLLVCASLKLLKLGVGVNYLQVLHTFNIYIHHYVLRFGLGRAQLVLKEIEAFRF